MLSLYVPGVENVRRGEAGVQAEEVGGPSLQGGVEAKGRLGIPPQGWRVRASQPLLLLIQTQPTGSDRNASARSTPSLRGGSPLPMLNSLQPTSPHLSPPARKLPPYKRHPLPRLTSIRIKPSFPVLSALFTLLCCPEILLYPASVLVINQNANR